MRSLIISLLILLVFSCAPSTSKQHPTWYNVSISEPVTLNPVTASDAYESSINSYVFDSLLNVDKNLNIIPELAKSWEISDNHLVYTFHLRDDVKWHDGEKFSAHDVKFTYDKIMDPKSKAMNKRASYSDVEKVEVLDDYTFRVTYKEPYADALLSWAMVVIPKHIFENLENYDDSPIEYAPALYVVVNSSYESMNREERGVFRDALEKAWKEACDEAGIREKSGAVVEILDNAERGEYEGVLRLSGGGDGGVPSSDYAQKFALCLDKTDKSLSGEAKNIISEMGAKRLRTRPTFLNNKFNRAPIGTGPYKFVEWKTRSHILLEKADEHWRDEPQIEKIKFKFILESAMQLNAYKKGAVDAVAMSPEQWVREKDSPSIKKKSQLITYPRLSFAYIGWNMDGSNPFFSDKRVRRAMTHALPRKEVIEAILHGYARIVTGPFHPDVWAYNTNLAPFAFAPSEADRLLTEAGWVDEDRDGIREKIINGEKVDFVFEILYGEKSETGEALLLRLKEELEKLGVIMDLHSLEWSAFSKRVHSHEFSAALLAWNLGLANDVYDLFHSSQAEMGLNYYSYSNATVDRLMEKARIEFDKNQRTKMSFEIHKYIHEDQPYTFLWSSEALIAIHKRFQNVESSAVGVTGYYPGLRAWTIDMNEVE